MRRVGDNAPLEYVDLSMKSPIPVQIDRFWSCSKNNENIQVLSRKLFKEAIGNYRKVVMSGYVTDANGVQDCVKVNGDQLSIRNDLNSDIEEADERIIPHVAGAVKDGSKRVVILSNDVDVVMLLLYFFHVFSEMGVEEL